MNRKVNKSMVRYGASMVLFYQALMGLMYECFVIAPDQVGHHGGKRRSFGKSTIIDPWGTPLAIAPDRPSWVMAQVNLHDLERVRASLPCLSHRHPGV